VVLAEPCSRNLAVAQDLRPARVARLGRRCALPLAASFTYELVHALGAEETQPQMSHTPMTTAPNQHHEGGGGVVALKKSDLYSSLWSSADELRTSMAILRPQRGKRSR